MPTATKKSKVAVEEEKPKKKKIKSPEAKNGKVTVTKPAAKIIKKKKVSGPAPTARDMVLRVLVEGAPRTEIKSRARKLAEAEGADVSFKTFDVGYFIKYLTEKKGYTLEEKKNGVVKLSLPGSTKKKTKEKSSK